MITALCVKEKKFYKQGAWSYRFYPYTLLMARVISIPIKI